MYFAYKFILSAITWRIDRLMNGMKCNCTVLHNIIGSNDPIVHYGF